MAQEKRHRASKPRRADVPVGEKEEEPMEGQTPDSDKTVEDQKPPEEPEPADSSEATMCPVVGVGASAGGLEALQGLLAHLPEEPPMAMVIVQHRASDRTSVMKSLLERHSTFQIVDIEDSTEVKPGTAYLAPADK